MSSLPHPITEALHIDEPFPTWTLLVAALLLWALYRGYRYWRARAAAAPSEPVRAAPPPPEGERIVSVIEAIRQRTLEQHAYRAGCHQLAAALKEHFGRSLSPERSFERMTASEIARRIGDGAVSRYFDLLSRLQFFRRPPSRNDFDGACDLALDVVVTTSATARSRRGDR